MKILALVSGGKDSIYSLCKLKDEGHEIVAILHMRSTEEYSDSYMFQTVGSEIAELMGECLACPIFISSTKCNSISTSLDYSMTVGDEVEELFDAVSNILKNIQFEAICSGAILSNYQKRRVENICKRLNLESIAPLWKREQKELLKETIDYVIDARIVKIASPVLKKSCLGMTLREIYDYLENIDYPYELNFCGEGGEYETAVFDCKHFKKSITFEKIIENCHPEEDGKDGSVFYITVEGLKVKEKL